MLQKETVLIVKESSEGKWVDARELHRQLEISTKFSMWIKNRIQEFGFEQGKDYFPNLGSKIFGKWGGHNRTDYRLTLDMAKELAMLERSDMGRRIRRYFIAVENTARRAYDAGLLRQSQYDGSLLALPEGLAERSLNDRRLLPYRDFLIKIGTTPGGSAYRRKKRYPNHFVKLDKLWYITEELAQQIQLTMAAYRNRKPLDAMAPVLALDFGESMEGGAK